MIRVFARVSVIAGLLAVTAVPANAQIIGQAVGGMTSAADQQIFLGGSLGARAGAIEFDVEVGRMRDILPKNLFEAFNRAQDELDLPVRAIARLTNTYVSGNVRLISPAGPVRPFIGGGAGLAHLVQKFEVTVGDFNLGDLFGTASDSSNNLMLNGGGGLSFDVGERATFDLGYRYVYIPTDFSGLNLDGVDVKAHVFYVAFGSRF